MLIYSMRKRLIEGTYWHEFLEIQSLEVEDREVFIDGQEMGEASGYEKLAICQGAGFIPVIIDGEVVLGKVVNLVKQEEDGIINE